MKKYLFLLFILITSSLHAIAQGCSSCGGLGASATSSSDDGPNFSVSVGMAQYGQSAGDLTFGGTVPDISLYTPQSLQFDSPTRPDVTVLATNVVLSNTVITTNIVITVNFVTNTVTISYTGIWTTNTIVAPSIVITTNLSTNSVIYTNAAILQVQAPQAIADIPNPPTINGYAINFYYPSQVTGTNGAGLFTFTGTPFITWVVTNSNPGSINQLRVLEYGNVPSYGLLKQWDYSYSAGSSTWSVQALGAVQKNMSVTNLSTNLFQVINTVQYSNATVVRQVKSTYQTFNWSTSSNVALVEVAAGSDSAPQLTTYTYWDPAAFGAPALILPRTISHPDGSWEYYAAYDSSGRPTAVYSSFGDVSLSYATNHSGGNAREVDYTYDVSTAGVSGSGDDGTQETNTARLIVENVQGSEVSRQYTVFPSLDKRLEIRCSTAGAAWNNSGNLITTNSYYTNGPNQFALKAVVYPDGTMTTYNYLTNAGGIYQTNITATGQPDSTFSYIIDGTTNVTVLNQFGELVLRVSADIVSGIVLAQDTYGAFDDYGRPQQVTHLDGKTEYTQYACCGLDSTTDRDGTVTQYLYDSAKRQVGYTRNSITYSNLLDAAGNVLVSTRIGSDNSQIIQGQWQYDLAGERITQTNALNGVTTFIRTNDATTGGLIEVRINPDSGSLSNFYYLDGSLKQTTGTATYSINYLEGVDGSGLYMAQVKLNNSGGTNEWKKNYNDLLGRRYKTVYAAASGTPFSISYFNDKGQLTNQIDPDGVSTIYVYNAKGERTHSIVDMNQDGMIDWNGSDRITFITNDVVTDSGANVRRTRTYVFTTSGSNASNLVSTTEQSVEGLTNRNTIWNNGVGITSQTITAYGSSGYRFVTNQAPDNSYTVSIYQYGQLLSVARTNASTQLSQTTYAYDTHGRRYASTDARNGTTTYYFNNADGISGMKTPSPDGVLSGQVSTNYFDNMLRAWKTTEPDGTSVTNEFYLTGETKRTYGSHTYPVGYGYDTQGRMTKMTNWTGFASSAGTRVTTWSYDAYRGFLSYKTYDSAGGPSYTYTAAGRLQTRLWARGTNTTYAYDGAGEAVTRIYNDGVTAGFTNGYDRRGRLTIVSNGPTVCNLTYNDAGLNLTEAYTGGPLNNISVTNGYDSLLRRTNMVTLLSGSILTTATNDFDAASRFNLISDGTNTATYSYLANSSLLSQIALAQSGTLRMTTTKNYDYLNRLTSINSVNASSVVLDSHGYTYNSANQRTAATNADNSKWSYQYDALGQVTSGKKYWSDGGVVAGGQFGYQFDDIGNRLTTQAGGDQWGANLRWANYSANSLNQYTSRTVPGAVDVIGSATNSATVTVNNQPAYRKSDFYRMQLPLTNAAGAVWQSVTNLAVLNQGTNVDIIASNVGNIFLPQTSENFIYDADGNLTSDGRWTNTWDAENRLINMTSLSSGPAGSKLELDFGYDYKGRRVRKMVSMWSGSSYLPQSTNIFVYNGWNLVNEMNAANSAVIRSYLWGMDLGGSMQGAGGVGGLVKLTHGGTNCFVTYDGNGNVSTLASAADGIVLAQYEYGPFGELLRATGPVAKVNPFRFSTKYQDDETDLLYYGYRYYNSSMGKWIGRDKLGERGGVMLYGFTRNNPINSYDLFGMLCTSCANLSADQPFPPGVPLPPPGEPPTSTGPAGSPSDVAVIKCNDERNSSTQGQNNHKKDPSRKCVWDCDKQIADLMKNDPDVLRTLSLFKGSCQVPRVKCKKTPPGIGGSAGDTITIDPQEGADYKQPLLHELTHELQFCNKPNKDCTSTMEEEMEAYYCETPGSKPGFDQLLNTAIGSACNVNETYGCTGDDVKNNYNQWADWYNKNQANFCKGQGPTFPSTPGN